MIEGAGRGGQPIKETEMDKEPGEFLSEIELANLLKVSRTFLWRLSRKGRGPRFVAMKRKILYRMAEVNRWVEENTHQKHDEAR